ncbi:MAG: hypothetical protein RL497_1082 [Pseudomonadota bacterium]
MKRKSEPTESDDSATLTPEDLQLLARFVAQCGALKWGIQTEISARLKVSPRTISAIFTRSRLPGTRLLRAAAREGMDVVYVLTGEEGKTGASQAGDLAREIDRYQTVLRSVVAIIESELPGTRSGTGKEPMQPKLTAEQSLMLAKYTNADAQIRTIIDGILERVPGGVSGAEKLP